MADIKYYDVILRPVVTEKAMAQGEKVYTFYVHPEANKAQIKEAVQKMFDGVTVEKVNTMNIPGKKKRQGRLQEGYTAKRKKAVVKLTKDSKDIVLFEGL